MVFVPKLWKDLPDQSTPLTAAAMIDLESRLAAYAESQPLAAVNVKTYGAIGNGVADDTTAIQAAINACNAAGGGIVWFPPGTYIFTTLSLVSMNNVRLVGASRQSTILKSANTTGSVFDFTDASFCAVEDLGYAASAQRTTGAVFTLTTSAGACQMNRFHRLRIAGGWKIWNLINCNTTSIEDIQVTDFNAAHTWDSMIHLSGSAVSTIVRDFRGGSAAAVTNAVVYITGSTVDTAHFFDFDVLNFGPSTGQGGALVSAGSWIKFVSCSFESGTTKDAIIVNGTALAVDIVACHLLGKRGLTIGGGTAVRMIGGELVGCFNGGCILGGGSHHELIGVTISDCSQSGDVAFNGVQLSNVTTDWRVVGCNFGNMLLGSGNRMATAITVGAFAADRYTITGNIIGSTGVVTAFSDLGTGTDKVIKDNVGVGSGFQSVASAATLTLPVGVSVVNVTGVTNITAMTATWKGHVVTLNFAGILTFTDGGNLLLAGNFVTTPDDTITLACDGTNWREIARSVN